MALFRDNMELGRQARHVGFDAVDGFNKSMLGVLGFKETGERNLWGKLNPAQLIPGVSTLSNVAAGALSKGTDTNEVIKGGRDEALSNEMNKLAFAKDVAAMAVGGGAGNVASGGNGGIGSSLKSVLGIGDGDSGSGILKSIMGKKSADGAQEDLDKSVESSTADTDFDNKMNPDSFSSQEEYENYWTNQGYSFDEEGNLLDPEGNPAQEQKMGLGDKLKGGLKSVLAGGGNPIESGTRALVGAMGYNDALSDEYNQMQRRSNMSNFSYL